MDLKVPIKIFDELAESVIESSGTLDLASGEIRSVEYLDYDIDLSGLPAEDENYEFTMGMLSNGDRDVEFRIDVRNGRANGALRKLGATQEGLLRRARANDGEFHDQVLWAIVATDWHDIRTTRTSSVH